MKNKTTARFAQWLGFIVAMTVIGFSFAACDNGPDKGVAPTITTTSLPEGTEGTEYNQTLAATGDKPITWGLESGALPAGLNLAETTGDITGIPTTAETSTFTVKATNAAGSDTKEFTITIGGVPTITTAVLPNGVMGTAYSQTLAARGGTPITWSIESGELPAGLTLAATGTITGTPTTANTSTFTVMATNTDGSDTKQLSITITAVAITTTSLPNGVVGTAYSRTLVATGGTPITWSVDSGTLPAGLNLAETGAITGTPTAAGTSTFTVKATNTAGSDTKQLSITITAGSQASIEMVQIPGGTFQMGSPASEPDRASDETQHSVTLTGFRMGKYLVTQAQYEAVMGTNPSNFKTPVSPETSTANRPVENVNWYNALVFCNKLSVTDGLTPAYRIDGSTDPTAWGTVPTNSNSTWNAVEIVAGSTGYRLPTEAQWEYACRAGTTTAYNTGATIIDNTGWYIDNSGARTHSVGEKPANAWGLYDMHGNVYERCWDWYSSSYYSSSPEENPTGAVSGSERVMRGGTWSSTSRFLRSAFRSYIYPYSGSNVIGFRLVRPAQ